MPVYEYRGLNQSGKNVRGTLDAESSRAARTRLKRDGIYVVQLRDKTKKNTKKKGKKEGHNKTVSASELSMMTRQLATLIRSNIPLVDSLNAVSEQTENPVLSECMADVKNAVNEGSAFYKALSKYPGIFNRMYVSMCEAGEMSGTLDIILIRLAEFTENQSELKNKIRSAVAYPAIMVVVTLGILAVLFVFVLPKVTGIFESNPQLTLPWYTLAVIGFSGVLVNYWHILLMGAGLAFLIFRSWKNTPRGRVQWDAIVLKLPIVGRLARTVAVSRFTRTLATLLNGGVPMLTSMNIVRNVVNNEVLAKAIDDARENISEGESIATPLKKSGEFPPIVIHMVNIGEKTGELETMLNQISDSYDFQVKTSVDALTSSLEPLMIVMMGGVIGIIVFSIMIPMLELSSLGGV